MQTTVPAESVWQLPQLDVNYGLGGRIQLTAEIPYLVVNRTGLSHVSDRRLRRGAAQGHCRSRAASFSAARGCPQGRLAERRSRSGTYVPWHGEHEDILGLVVGRQFGSRLELDAEFYEDHVRGAEDVTTLDVGGRYHLHRGFNLLFMAGRSVGGNSAERVDFMGYLGIQILLSDYGRKLSEEP